MPSAAPAERLAKPCYGARQRAIGPHRPGAPVRLVVGRARDALRYEHRGACRDAVRQGDLIEYRRGVPARCARPGRPGPRPEREHGHDRPQRLDVHMPAGHAVLPGRHPGQKGGDGARGGARKHRGDRADGMAEQRRSRAGALEPLIAEPIDDEQHDVAMRPEPRAVERVERRIGPGITPEGPCDRRHEVDDAAPLVIGQRGSSVVLGDLG